MYPLHNSQVAYTLGMNSAAWGCRESLKHICAANVMVQCSKFWLLSYQAAWKWLSLSLPPFGSNELCCYPHSPLLSSRGVISTFLRSVRGQPSKTARRGDRGGGSQEALFTCRDVVSVRPPSLLSGPNSSAFHRPFVGSWNEWSRIKNEPFLGNTPHSLFLGRSYPPKNV